MSVSHFNKPSLSKRSQKEADQQIQFDALREDMANQIEHLKTVLESSNFKLLAFNDVKAQKAEFQGSIQEH